MYLEIIIILGAKAQTGAQTLINSEGPAPYKVVAQVLWLLMINNDLNMIIFGLIVKSECDVRPLFAGCRLNFEKWMFHI